MTGDRESSTILPLEFPVSLQLDKKMDFISMKSGCMWVGVESCTMKKRALSMIYAIYQQCVQNRWFFKGYNIQSITSMQGFAAGNNNPEDYWKQSSFSYKCCCVSSTIIFLISLLVPAIILICIDVPQLTIWSFQLWRLLLSMYGQIPNIFSILSILFSFMWLHSILKDSEHSTIYKIFQIAIINIEIHLVFNIISLLFTILFDTENSVFFFGYGWFPIILVYQFRASATNPEADRRFCCLPFLIKNRYYPWVLLFLLGMFSTQFLCFISCGIVGYYQEVVRKEMFIKLPLCFYQKVQSILPMSITRRSDFVPISSVQANLKTKCFRRSQSRDQPSPRNANNPYAAQNQHQNQQRQGPEPQYLHSIGGKPVSDFRNYWAQKDEESTSKSNTNAVELEIEPRANFYHNKQDLVQNQSESNSYAALTESTAWDKKLLAGQQRSEEFAAQQKDKKGKQQHKNSPDNLI